MNEAEATALLERLADNVVVPPPPVAALAAAGRRRLRIRRSAQLAGVAGAAVLAIGGGLLVAPDIQRHHSASASPSGLPGRAPTAKELIGNWQPTEIFGQDVTDPAFPDVSRSALSISHRANALAWSSYAQGCSWTSGRIDLGADGSFSTYANVTTGRGCMGPSLPTGQSVGIVAKATQVRVNDGELLFFDDTETLLGSFTRPAEMPGRPPTAAELMGNWQPTDLFGHDVTGPDYPGDGFMALAITGPNSALRWLAYAGGCDVRSGRIDLGAHGSFSTFANVSTHRPCIGPSGPALKPVDVVHGATQVRVNKGTLLFFDDDDSLIGSFVRIKATSEGR